MNKDESILIKIHKLEQECFNCHNEKVNCIKNQDYDKAFIYRDKEKYLSILINRSTKLMKIKNIINE
jgi:hypothetical protein